MNSDDSLLVNDQQIHDWLEEISSLNPNNMNERQAVSSKQRPLSISSEDSVNLDELINANFTTNMEEETDLTTLASIDLDDSSEDFWKLDNIFHHYVPPTGHKKPYGFEQDHILNTINLSSLSIYDKGYPNRYDRSGSLSSDNSSSTTNSYHIKRPQPIPSISSSSSTTTSSLLFMPKKPAISKSETTKQTMSRSVSQMGLSRRATHIPSPKISSPMPQKTKSTASVLNKKSSTGSLTRPTSRITSHIPAPPIRSTTSLGLYTQKTSMGKQSPKSLRTPSLLRSPTKSTKMPSSRSFVN